jgi:hypothetical protein
MATRAAFNLLIVTTMLLAACAPASIADPTVEPTDQPTTEPGVQPTPGPVSVPESVKQALARELGLAPDDITITLAEEVDWPDACLGLPAEGEVCAAVITSGYGGMLEANGRQYEFRSDATGKVVRLIPGAALSARQVLAQQLHVAATDIAFVSVEAVEWPDGCLGIEIKDMACIQIVIPGYRVVLEVNGQRYEYHTDETGSNVRLASAPSPDIEDVAIVWTQTAEACATAQIGSQAIAFGPCSGPLMAGQFIGEERAADFAYFVETYAPFEAETPAGEVSFAGKGAVEATLAEQRMIAEWARLVALEAAGGHGGASWGLAFTWHREGGIAGFCDDVTVYVSGEVYLASCQHAEPENLGRGRLNADQLEQVYAWLDGLKNFEYEQRDKAVADAMTLRLVFSGAGTREATEADRQAIIQFAQALVGTMSER